MDKKFSTAVLALTLTNLSSAWPQGELFNYGRQWESWSNEMRSVYLIGFVDGQSSTYTAMINDVPMERKEPLRMEYTLFTGLKLSANRTLD